MIRKLQIAVFFAFILFEWGECAGMKRILQDVTWGKKNLGPTACSSLIHFSRTTLENWTKNKQTFERTVELSFQESMSWSRTEGIEVGAMVAIQATIPWTKLGIKVSTSLTKQTSWTEGKSTSKSLTESVKVTPVLEGRSKMTVNITAKQIQMVVRYAGKLVTERDGKRVKCERVYGDMTVHTVVLGSDVHIKYGVNEPLNASKPTNPDNKKKNPTPIDACPLPESTSINKDECCECKCQANSAHLLLVPSKYHMAFYVMVFYYIAF